MSLFLDRTALITGAASGIGRALAEALAARGAHLALVDIDGAGLEETAAALRSNQRRVTTHVADMADAAQIAALPAAVAKDHPGVDLLFNNAGAALGGHFTEVAAADFEWLMDVNFNGVVRMTRAFLPQLIAAPAGRLVNVSSLYGIIAPPGQTAYSASKFAVRGFTEALRHELAETRVGVHTVHPGGIKTNIARNARSAVEMTEAEMEERVKAAEAIFITEPKDAAETILSGVAVGRPRILIGRDAKVVSLLERLFPTSVVSILMKRLSAHGPD